MAGKHRAFLSHAAKPGRHRKKPFSGLWLSHRPTEYQGRHGVTRGSGHSGWFSGT